MNGTTVKKVTTVAQLQDVFQKSQAQKTPVSLYRKTQVNEVSLDFTDWKDIETFDIDNLMVIVPPGIQLKELNAVAAAKGLRFVPADTPAMESLSIGEWAYKGCPNLSSWKYGAGKHFLLGSSYVLPNGEFVSVGGKCIKNVTGYDLTRFLTGGYADLAAGVQFIIKLLPQPAFRQRYDVTFQALQDVIRLVSHLQACSVPPGWLYWFDEVTGSQVFGKSQSGHRLLFELDGNEAEVREGMETVDNLVAQCRGQKAAIAADMPDLSYVESAEQGFWLIDEFKVPYTKMITFAGHYAKLLAEKGLHGGLFGQMADGKVHLYIDKKASPEFGTIISGLRNEIRNLGGASSGKYARLYESESSGPLAALERAFKKNIDPQLIFNRRRSGL